MTLDNVVKSNNKYSLNSVVLEIVPVELSPKRMLRGRKSLATISPLALVLAACGSSSDDSATTSAQSTVLTLTKDGDNYTSSTVSGFSLGSTTVAKYDVSDSTTNAFEIKLDATGSGTLEFDFVDANDTVTLSAGSKTSGFTTLKVTDGTIDATNADLSGITKIEVASGIKISLAQIKDIPTIVSNSEAAKVEVVVSTEAEASELVTLISGGTINIYGSSNPVDMVAAAGSAVTSETLTAKVAETTSSLKAVADAPTDTSTTTTPTDTSTTTPTAPVVDTTPDDVIRFTLSGDASGNFTVGNSNGAVTLTASGTDYVATPSSGNAITLAQSDVTSFVANSVTVNAAAVVADGETITGSGNVAITALEGDAAADLSNMTVTGTKTAAVGGDVTFTGNLGTFTTTVASGATLTADVSKVQGKTIDGAGTVAITDLDTDLDADLSTITATSVTAAFNDTKTFTGNFGTAAVTVASGKTLTAAATVVAGENIDGAGSLTITGGATDDANLTDIDITGTLAFDSNTIAITAAKTLTLDAVQASKATSGISGDGNLTVTDDGGAADSTIVSTVSKTGVKTIDAGTGDDVINLGAAENVDTDDTIDGGTGTDEIKLTADAGTTGAVLDDLIAIDTITMVASTTKDAKVTVTYTSSNTDAMTITAAAMSNAAAVFTLDADDSEVGGALTVTGGAAGDTILTGSGADTVTGGTGADTIHVGAGLDKVVTAAGSTEVTISLGAAASGTGANASITGYDKVTGGLVRSDGTTVSETLDVGGTASVVADATNVDGTDVTGYYENSAAGDKAIVVKTHTITDGIVVFTGDQGDHGTSNNGINGAALTSVVTADTLGIFIKYLQGVDLTAVGKTVAFKLEAGSTDDLVVFTQGTADGSTDASDQVVWIVGEGAVDALITTTNTAGANDFFIM